MYCILHNHCFLFSLVSSPSSPLSLHIHMSPISLTSREKRGKESLVDSQVMNVTKTTKHLSSSSPPYDSSVDPPPPSPPHPLHSFLLHFHFLCVLFRLSAPTLLHHSSPPTTRYSSAYSSYSSSAFFSSISSSFLLFTHTSSFSCNYYSTLHLPPSTSPPALLPPAPPLHSALLHLLAHSKPPPLPQTPPSPPTRLYPPLPPASLNFLLPPTPLLLPLPRPTLPLPLPPPPSPSLESVDMDKIFSEYIDYSPAPFDSPPSPPPLPFLHPHILSPPPTPSLPPTLPSPSSQMVDMNRMLLEYIYELWHSQTIK